jgi:hypothetical protein
MSEMVKGLLITQTVTITQFVPMTAYELDGVPMSMHEAVDHEDDQDEMQILESFAATMQATDFEASRAIVTASTALNEGYDASRTWR